MQTLLRGGAGGFRSAQFELLELTFRRCLGRGHLARMHHHRSCPQCQRCKFGSTEARTVKAAIGRISLQSHTCRPGALR